MVSVTIFMNPSTRKGMLYGLAAYGWWGLVVVYFKAVDHVSPPEVLAHRVIWSVALLALLMARTGRGSALKAALRDPRTLRTLTATTLLVGGNWFVFIWAVGNDRVLEASLGYFINPLVNVFLGFIVLRERLRPLQWISVALAFGGVAYLALDLGVLPWVSIFLAFSFGFYGLLRKTASVDSMTGLTVECLLLLPFALSYLIILAVRSEIAFATVSRSTDGLLLLAGVVTALPLLWFAKAARRLPLATIGFMQYIAPSLHFLLAVTFLGEPFIPAFRITFGCIWIALVLFSADQLRRRS